MIYYLNTYDAAARFDLNDQQENQFLNQLELAMSELGFTVERVNIASTKHLYNEEDLFTIESNEHVALKNLGYA